MTDTKSELQCRIAIGIIERMLADGLINAAEKAVIHRLTEQKYHSGTVRVF